MENTREYLRTLLDTAISTPTGEIVNFQALRKLLEESIEHCGEDFLERLDTHIQKNVPGTSVDQAQSSSSTQPISGESSEQKEQKEDVDIKDSGSIDQSEKQLSNADDKKEITIEPSGGGLDVEPTRSKSPELKDDGKMPSTGPKAGHTSKSPSKSDIGSKPASKAIEQPQKSTDKSKDIGKKASGPIKSESSVSETKVKRPVQSVEKQPSVHKTPQSQSSAKSPKIDIKAKEPRTPKESMKEKQRRESLNIGSKKIEPGSKLTNRESPSKGSAQRETDSQKTGNTGIKTPLMVDETLIKNVEIVAGGPELASGGVDENKKSDLSAQNLDLRIESMPQTDDRSTDPTSNLESKSEITSKKMEPKQSVDSLSGVDGGQADQVETGTIFPP